MTGPVERLAAVRERLYSAVLSDVLDGLGYREQAMRPGIRPLDDALVLVGTARTGRYQAVDGVPPGHNPYALEIALIDDLRPGEIAVLACGDAQRIAPWGELLTTAARARGATGCVTDGLVRDVRAIRDLAFPVFHGGINPLDSAGRGEVQAIDEPVVCGGVRVAPGDLVFGDVDGVVVVPQAVVDEALARAFAKVDGENAMRTALQGGMSLAEAFRKFGIL